MPLRYCYYFSPILISLISAMGAFAATATPTPTPTATRTVKFAWKASTSPEVVGYKIFWGPASHNYQSSRDVKNNLTASLALDKSSKYYIAVVGYTMAETTSFSNEVIVNPL